MDHLSNGSWSPISTGNLTDRREHFSASGISHNKDEPKIESSFRVIGTVKYCEGIGATEYDRKTSKAARKLIDLQKDKVKPCVATGDYVSS
jgi:hypothetical protein